jgi:hypothetical protein
MCGLLTWLKSLYCDQQNNSSIISQMPNRPCHISIAPGECVKANEKIYSCSKDFYIQLTTGGNFGVFTKESALTWSTNTNNLNVTKACMNNNGNFELITENNLIVFSSNTSGYLSAYAEVQSDGKFAIKKLGNVLYESLSGMMGLRYSCGKLN